LIIPSLSMIFAVDDPFIVIDFEDFYSGVSFSSNFGTGVLTYASSSGDQFGLSNFSGYDMVVPSGYASGDPLSFEMIFNSTDLATLGATPGVYDWTWGTGTPNADFFRLCVGSPCPTSTTSVPGPLPLLGVGAAFGFSRKLRTRIKGAPQVVSAID